MPKTLNWPQNGHGSRRVIVSDDVEVLPMIGPDLETCGWTIRPTKGYRLKCEAVGAAQERLHRKNDEAAAAKLSDVVGEGYAEALYGTERSGYIISRPSQNPPVLPPLDPVDAPNWTMPLRIGLGLAAVVVVVILAVVL